MSQTAQKQAELLVDRLRGNADTPAAAMEGPETTLAGVIALPTRFPKPNNQPTTRPIDKKGRFKSGGIRGFAELGWKAGPLEVEIVGSIALLRAASGAKAPNAHGFARISTDGRVLVPKVVRFHLDIEPGDEVLVVVGEGGVVALVNPCVALIDAPEEIVPRHEPAKPEAAATPAVTMRRSTS